MTFTVEGQEPERVAAEPRPSSTSPTGLTSVVRTSVHYDNTEAELDRCAELVADLARSA